MGVANLARIEIGNRKCGSEVRQAGEGPRSDAGAGRRRWRGARCNSYLITRGMLFHQRSRSSDKSQANSPFGVLICNFEPPTRPNFATLISKIFPCARTLEAWWGGAEITI